MIIYCILDCTRNILASLSFWMLCLQHRTSSKKFLCPKKSEEVWNTQFQVMTSPMRDLRRTSIHKRIQGGRSRKATQNYLNCCFWIVREHNQVLLHHWNHLGWTVSVSHVSLWFDHVQDSTPQTKCRISCSVAFCDLEVSNCTNDFLKFSEKNTP